LISGAYLYDGDLAAIRAGHLTQAPPEAPCDNTVLRNLIGRLLAKRPEERPQDARAVLERLRRALVTRSRTLESIARGLIDHAAERARADAEESTARASEYARRQLTAQAKQDLREIIDDALGDLRADVEPDAAFEETGDGRWAEPSFSLTAGDVGLRIELWDSRTRSRRVQPVQDDTMVLAGHVMINNPRQSVPVNSANLVYEQVGDRLAWQIYRFRGAGDPSRYGYGPYGRTHGLSERTFFDPQERYAMLHSVMLHPWTKTITPLTAETLLELFQEAVELRPPDPRTDIY
jgi:hypothetical protein